MENALLRQQLIVASRKVKRPIFTPLERGFVFLLASFLPHWRNTLLLVKPDTVLRWHREISIRGELYTLVSLARQPLNGQLNSFGTLRHSARGPSSSFAIMTTSSELNSIALRRVQV